MGGRKFAVCVGAHLLNVALILTGVIQSAEFVQLSMFVLGGYITSNVAQKALVKK